MEKQTESAGPVPVYEEFTTYKLVGWQVTCAECGEAFQAKRNDATLCSPKCRQRRHSRGKKENAALV